MARYRASHEAVLSGIIGTASIDFIMSRNREVIAEMRKDRKLDKNGCYLV